MGYIYEDEDALYKSLANKMGECYNIDPSDSHSCDDGNSGEPRHFHKSCETSIKHSIGILFMFQWVHSNKTAYNLKRIRKCFIKNITGQNMIVQGFETYDDKTQNNSNIFYHASDDNAFLNMNIAGYILMPSCITVALTLAM